MIDKIRNDKRIMAVLLLLVIGLAGFIFYQYIFLHQYKYSRIVEKYEPRGGLIYGADDSSYPLHYLSVEGEFKGLTVDYMSQLSVETGIDITCKPYKEKNLLKAMEDGSLDITERYVGESDDTDYVYTDPIYTLRAVLVVNKDSYYTENSIPHMRIAVQKGAQVANYLKSEYPSVKLIPVDDISKGLEMMQKYKLDGVIGSEPTMFYYCQHMNMEDSTRFVGTHIYEGKVALALPKSEEDLIPVLNSGIENLQSQDSLEKLLQKWHVVSTSMSTINSNTRIVKFLLLFLLAALAGIVFFLFTSRKLQHLVEARTRELNHKTAELNTQTEELQFIFDHIPEQIIMIDHEGNVRGTNFTVDNPDAPQRVCRTFLKPFCQGVDCGSKPMECGAGCLVKSCMESEGAIVRKAEYQNRTLRLQASSTSMDGDSDHDMVIAMVRDVTLDEINERRLLQNSKMIAVGQLAAGMSHQIKNPLGSIRLHSYLLREEKEDDAEVIESLDYMDESVNRISGIIDNVLNFWRLSGEETTAVPMANFFQQLYELEFQDFKGKQVSFRLDCAEDLQVNTNPESLKHIFYNLMSNSLDALEQEGEIAVTVKEERDFVIVEHRDNGQGMSAETITNIYNPFFTTKEPGKGTGLGMYIVYSEVEKIGGTIEIQSELGVGTTFIIKIPQERSKEDENSIRS